MGHAVRGGGHVVFDLPLPLQVHQSGAVRASLSRIQVINESHENRMEHTVQYTLFHVLVC